MSPVNIDRNTLKLIEEGQYINHLGKLVDFTAEQHNAEANTKLYNPEQLSNLVNNSRSQTENKPVVRIINETTSVAAHRLITQEACSDLALLHFASALNLEGDSFGWGKAQEEDLINCSGLYSCLLTQPDYYKRNCINQSLLYTDNIIYSPQVPWLKTRSRQSQLLDNFFQASVITASAPNVGEIFRKLKTKYNFDRKFTNITKIEETLRRRVEYILAVARDNGHRALLLGAWGCGGLQNSIYNVANAFHSALYSSQFKDCFDLVVFAIKDLSKKKKTLRAFQDKFEYRYLAIELTEELKINKPLLPFWLKYPELDCSDFWAGVRLGYISYRDVWWFWAKEKSRSDLIEYFQHFTPIPFEWADWVGNWIFGDDFDDNDDWEKSVVQQMAQVGLINFDEWIEWYSDEEEE